MEVDRTNEGLFILKRSSWIPDKEPVNCLHVETLDWTLLHVRDWLWGLDSEATFRLTG